MTKKQIVSKFLDWATKKNLTPEIGYLDRNGKNSGYKIFRLMEYLDGMPWTTVCFEIFPPGTTEMTGWYSIIKRKCADTLTIDQFSEVGIGKSASIEEFMLKLEIAG